MTRRTTNKPYIYGDARVNDLDSASIQLAIEDLHFFLFGKSQDISDKQKSYYVGLPCALCTQKQFKTTKFGPAKANSSLGAKFFRFFFIFFI